MSRTTNALPSQQCKARSTRTGERCRRWIIGADVCPFHGGSAPQVKAKREQRIALAEQMARSERRHPAEVLLDTVHAADVLLQAAVGEAKSGRLSKRTVDGLTSAIDRAAAVSRMALSAGAEARSVEAAEGWGRQLSPVLEGFLERVGLAADPDAQAALSEAVAAARLSDRTAVGAAVQARSVALGEGQTQLALAVIRWVLAAVGLQPNRWADEQVVRGLQLMVEGAGQAPDGAPVLPAAEAPPASFWRQLRARCDAELLAAERAVGYSAPLALEGRIVGEGQGPSW